MKQDALKTIIKETNPSQLHIIVIGEGIFLRLGLNRGIRIRIFPAHMQPAWKSANKMLATGLILAVFAMGFTYYYTQINPLIVNLAKKHSYALMNTLINKVITRRMEQDGFAYEDFVTVERNENGQIRALFMNTKKINQTKTYIAGEIQKEIDKQDMTHIKLPFGAIFDIPLFSGMGPVLDVRLVPIGYVLTDFENSFSEAGINQTKHQIDIVVNANFGMILSAGSENIEIKTSVPIAQTIIVGEVPKGIIGIE